MSGKPVYLQLRRPNKTMIDKGARVKISSSGWFEPIGLETKTEERGLVYLPSEWRGRKITSLFCEEDKKKKWKISNHFSISNYQSSDEPIEVNLVKS